MLDEPQPIGTSAARDLKLIDAAQREAEEALRRAAQTAAVRNSPGSGAVAALTLPDALPGYEILREIHRGGQGVVYQAIQKSTQRKVAIKVLHEGPFAGPRSRVRFEREVQILGALNHPNIVTIHDSGRAAGDALYYVMDYVRGRSLREFVREQRLALEPALELFATVCEAVQHAHTRGIIHRDLKPGNILVDAEGRPIVVDFGFGKLLTGTGIPPGSPAVSMTQDVMGTLAYMSPEQTRGNPDEIDTRTDVYSLGVILYELLTGRHPYTTTGSMPDVVREIREAEPTPPTRRWSSDSGIVARSRRGLAPGRCPIDDEVQTIVLRCLAKESERRYQSAGEIARDIRHYLAGEPIEAKRDSASYMLRKHLRKYRVHAGVSAGFVLLLVISTAALWVMYRGQSRERQLAEQTQKRAEAINEFVKKALVSSDPNQGGQQDTLVADAMMNALKQIDAGAFKDEPENEAGLRETIAGILVGNGRAAEAEPLCVQALEIRRRLFKGDHPDVAQGLNNLASVRQALGRAAEAEPLYVQARGMNQRLFKGDHPAVATSMSNLAGVRQALGRAAEAEPLYVQALEMRQRLYKGDHPDVARGLNNLAVVRQLLVGAAEAEALYAQALEMQQRLFKGDHPDVARSLNSLANARLRLGRAAEAEPLFVRALQMQQRLFKGDHPDMARSLHDLATARSDLGRAAEAEPLYVQALDMWQRLFKGDHPDVAGCMNSLAKCLDALGRGGEAIARCREALAMERRVLPPDSPALASSMAQLGLGLVKAGTPQAAAEAEPILRECLAMREKAFAEGHPQSWLKYNTMSLLGGALAGQGNFTQAEPLLLEGYNSMKDDPHVPPPVQAGGDRKREALERIVKLYEAWDATEPGTGKPEKAAEYRALLDAFDSATDH